MRTVTLLAMTILIAVAAAAQKKEVPPPPKPVDEGPSLADTMKFIQKHLNDQGKVGRVISKTLESGRFVDQLTSEISDTVAAVDTCKVTYVTNSTTVGNFYPNQRDPVKSASSLQMTYELTLRDVSRIEVSAETDWARRSYPKTLPFPEDYRVDPEVYDLLLYMVGGKKVPFRNRVSTSGNKNLPESGTLDGPVRIAFSEEEMAQRIAKAMVHAVELCGGGEKDEKEPF